MKHMIAATTRMMTINRNSAPVADNITMNVNSDFSPTLPVTMSIANEVRTTWSRISCMFNGVARKIPEKKYCVANKSAESETLKTSRSRYGIAMAYTCIPFPVQF